MEGKEAPDHGRRNILLYDQIDDVTYILSLL